MSNRRSTDILLAQWRLMAKAENARAREVWGFAGKIGWPDDPGLDSVQTHEARAERDKKVLVLSEAGRSIPQISRLMGVSRSTVWRILHRKPVAGLNGP